LYLIDIQLSRLVNNNCRGKIIHSDMADKFIGYIVLCAVFAWSCSKDPEPVNNQDGVYAIRSINYSGKTYNRFIYNTAGKIAEYQSFYFCCRYTYNENGLLIKEESANADGMQSSATAGGKELMTSQNSIFTSYGLYIYEHDSLLKQKIYYRENNGVFELVSKSSFEYLNGNIVKWNIQTPNDTITQYYTYEYDNNRNVTRQRQYSYLAQEGEGPVLIRETTYSFDNKNNPFFNFKQTGSPGIFSNPNNITETSSTLFIEVPGIDKYTHSTSSYEYNSKGYPVKVTSGSTVYAYEYY